jgi:small subunit ribosomal protein S4
MVRYTGPKNRIARRFGANIFGRLRNPLLHKATPPGMHGASRKKKSDFGSQLDEQQRLRAIYGMLPRRQLIRYYRSAERSKTATPQALMERLECRLDTVVYRLKFGATIFAAQQLVSHGHILVDGKKVDRRGFQVRPGMVITLKEKSKEVTHIKQALSAARDVPEYLALDADKFSGKLEVLPVIDQIPLPIPVNIPLICDFLAHTS